MSMIAPMIAEFEYESATTRRVLERIPEEKFDWKPHDKSFSFAQLASHISEMAVWVGAMVDQDVFDMPSDYTPWEAGNREELLAKFDEGVAIATEKMATVTDEKALATWKMTAAGDEIFEMPRISVLRSFILNHVVHHRGQLTVYLRLNDLPVPAVYGPSADEAPPTG